MADDLKLIQIPKNVENLSLPDPSLVTFYKEIERRTLWIDDVVDLPTLEIERYILNFNKEDAGKPVEERVPIKLMFFTPGGDLDVNNSLIDLIMMSKTPIWAINMGVAQSAGAFIFLSCHKRFAMPRSVFLLHQGSASMAGTHDQIEQVTTEYKRQIAELTDFVEQRTKIPRKTICTKIKREWFVGASEALEMGICDKIVDSIEELL